MRIIIMIAADVRPMIKPIQNPAGPMRSTTRSVRAVDVAARQSQYPVGDEGDKEDGARIFVSAKHAAANHLDRV